MADTLYTITAPTPVLTLDSIKSAVPVRLIPNDINLQDLVHSYSIADGIGIFFCGAVTLLTSFILLLYIKTKEKIYLHYVVFSFFMLFYGFIHIESGSWFQSYFTAIFKTSSRFIEPVTFLAFTSYIFFSIELIEVKKQSRQLYKLLNIFGYSVATYSVVYFILYPYIVSSEFAFYLYSRVIIYPLCTFFMSWIILKISSTVKYYFIIGSIAYFIGAVVATLRYTVDNIPIKGFYNITAPVYCEVGILIQILCFSLALGHRIYYLHRDKRLTNDKLIYQLSINEQMVKNMNIQLETEVKERTQEILEAQADLREQEKKRLQTEYKVDTIKTEMLAHRLQNYLLGPIDENELQKAVECWLSKLKQADHSDKIHQFLSSLKKESVLNNKIAVPIAEGFEFLEVKDILYCQSQNNYTYIYLANGEKVLISKTLKETEKALEEFFFIRTHQSYLANPNYMQKYFRSDGGYLVMTDGKHIPISNSKKELVAGIFQTVRREV